jgi:hypothetical protein
MTMKNKALKLGLVVALAILAIPAQARTDGQRAVGGVGERLRANDCEGAIKNLNAGLVAGYPEVELLAGTLFESGTCVTRDWNKAVRFYSQASEGGMRDGALRLAAGFAANKNGPDMAAAMWWARHAGLQVDNCTPHLPKTDDPDQFVQDLRAWPAHQLALCNYAVGVLSLVSTEARYPATGVAREIEGRLEIEYVPATSRFKVNPGHATGPATRGLAEVFARALAFATTRYRKPEGIDPAWTISFILVVDTDKSQWW